jgi:hypothetical protein
MSTVIVIGGGGGGGGGQQQNKVGTVSTDGDTIVGEQGETIMYCANPEEALRYLKRVCREE